jgi:hypothetical protein
VDCEKFDRVVLDLLYDELDELTRAAAMRHVEHCARCGPIANGLRATREVGTLPLVEPPGDLELKILQAERRVRARLPWRQRLGRAISIVAGYAMRPQLSMAALLLLMIGSSLLVLRSHPSDRDQGRVKESGVPEIEGEAPAGVVGPGHAQPAPAASAFASPPARDERATNAPARAGAPAPEPGGLKSKRGPALEPSDDAASAALFAAQARREASGCAAAAPRFEEVASRFPGSSAGYEAAWQAAECYSELGLRDRAERGYRQLAQTPGYEQRAQVALEALAPGTMAVARRQAAAKARAAAPAAAPPAEAGTQAAPERQFAPSP